MAVGIGRILVGVDGSDNGRRALEWAIVIGERFGAEVVAVHAVGLLTHLDDGPPVPSHSHMAQIRKVFESEWCAPLANSPVSGRTLCLDGPPVMVLLDAAESERAELIVVGSRGTGGFPELLLGSTSHQLAEHSRRPLLIVPPERPA